MGGLCMRVCAVALAGSLVLVGCASGPAAKPATPAPDASSTEKQEGPLSGGWETNTEVSSPTLTDEQQAIFRKASEGMLDVSYGPVAVIGQQVVAGTNYAYLCQNVYWEDDAVPEWRVMTVFHDLKGNDQITHDKGLDVANVRTSEADTDAAATGAWEAPLPSEGAQLPEAAQRAFQSATPTFEGKSLTPVALLGTQVVAGVNYRFVAVGPAKGDWGVACVADVYEDANGTCTTTSVSPLDLPYYVTE